ncbi:MAG: MotA/TolQ/ExbB proton channel family protein [Candidatus Eisenbacteria bacterium]|nr:MotA/TolQ/ExbB proton channel family protein [Candidatus Eisenbacteria bacterium]
MLRFFLCCGFWGWPLLAMAVAVLILSIKKAVDLFGGAGRSRARLERGLHSILFWGCLSAVTGVLGQISGIYNAVNIIVRAEAISPRVIAMGLAESFTSTLFGLTTLVFAALFWFVLYSRFRRLTAPVD